MHHRCQIQFVNSFKSAFSLLLDMRLIRITFNIIVLFIRQPRDYTGKSGTSYQIPCFSPTDFLEIAEDGVSRLRTPFGRFFPFLPFCFLAEPLAFAEGALMPVSFEFCRFRRFLGDGGLEP